MKSTEKPPIYWTPTIIFSATFLVAVTAVPYYGITYGYDTFEWLSFLILLLLNGLSITAGYHRLWAHNAYKAHPILRWILAIFGAMTVQNSILIWASGHRRHHRHVDDVDLDPYSAKRGLWFSHMGWMIRNYPSGAVNFDNAKDLQRDPVVVLQHKYYVPLVFATNFGIPILLGLIHGDVIAALLLGGVLRLVLCHHFTFFINSLAHYWGSQPYTDENTARDNPILAILTHGEGYHNYHHIFQTDYRNGIRWWQWDPTKWLIKGCSWIGLTSNLQTVSDFKIQKALITMQFKRANAKLDAAKNAEPWRAHLEREYQEFLNSMTEWRQLQKEWYEGKRKSLQNQFNEKKVELMGKRDVLIQKWEQAAVHTRIKELEYALKMQYKRLDLLSNQLAAV